MVGTDRLVLCLQAQEEEAKLYEAFSLGMTEPGHPGGRGLTDPLCASGQLASTDQRDERGCRVKVGPAAGTECGDLMSDQSWFFLAHSPSVSLRVLLS